MRERERERDADFGSVSHAGIGTDVWTLPFENITRILKVGEYPYLHHSSTLANISNLIYVRI